MKRIDLLVYLRKHECLLVREGKRHSIFVNSRTERVSAVPRHSEIDTFLARKICKDLGIPPIMKK